MAMRRKNGKSPMLDLTLSLSRPQRRGGSSEVIMAEDGSQSRSSSSSSSPKTSPPSSCVSSDNEQGKYSSSPKAASMVLAGCTRCLTYVMLPEEDPKCPRCKSTVLLDFFHGITTKKNKKR